MPTAGGSFVAQAERAKIATANALHLENVTAGRANSERKLVLPPIISILS
jgi:hypothetical protein